MSSVEKRIQIIKKYLYSNETRMSLRYLIIPLVIEFVNLFFTWFYSLFDLSIKQQTILSKLFLIELVTMILTVIVIFLYRRNGVSSFYKTFSVIIFNVTGIELLSLTGLTLTYDGITGLVFVNFLALINEIIKFLYRLIIARYLDGLKDDVAISRLYYTDIIIIISGVLGVFTFGRDIGIQIALIVYVLLQWGMLNTGFVSMWFSKKIN